MRAVVHPSTTRRRAAEGSRRSAACSSVANSRRQLANAAAYAEDEPHVTDSALDSLFEALYANGGAAAAAAALLSSPTERAGTRAVMGAEHLARAVAAAVCSTGAVPGARPRGGLRPLGGMGTRRVTSTIGRERGRPSARACKF